MNQVWLGTQKDCLGKTIMKIFILRDPRNGITAHLAKSYREISLYNSIRAIIRIYNVSVIIKRKILSS